MTKLAAVIVTYNRSEKLGRVLRALNDQTRKPDVVYVIDNASTDDTADVVRESFPDATYVRLNENIGGAGGFSLGIERAYDDGADLVWVSDDDAYPKPDAVQNLLSGLARFKQVTGRAAPFACSHVKWTDGTHCEMNTPDTVWDWPRHYHPENPVFLVQSCSFVSCLIPRWAIKTHGLPIGDYFIWFDDAEYTLRLSQTHPGLFVPSSIVVHDLPENKGVNYGLVRPDTIWKFKYGARNETSARLRMFGYAGVAEFWLRVHRQMKGRPIKLRLSIYRALVSGLFFRPKIRQVK